MSLVLHVQNILQIQLFFLLYTDVYLAESQ